MAFTAWGMEWYRFFWHANWPRRLHDEVYKNGPDVCLLFSSPRLFGKYAMGIEDKLLFLKHLKKWGRGKKQELLGEIAAKEGNMWRTRILSAHHALT